MSSLESQLASIRQMPVLAEYSVISLCFTVYIGYVCVNCMFIDFSEGLHFSAFIDSSFDGYGTPNVTKIEQAEYSDFLNVKSIL